MRLMQSCLAEDSNQALSVMKIIINRTLNIKSRMTGPGKLPDYSRGMLSISSHHPLLLQRQILPLIEHLGELIEGVPLKTKTETDPVSISHFLETWLKKTGAHSIGFTKLKPHHLYSHRGRGARNGEEVNNDHGYAMAISVEMDLRMMQAAPAGPTVMESSEQYLRSGVLALKAAAYIRNLGYEATAHIDGNYELIAPLVAADAGLGIIGRMGLLMTPRLGPRVRIAVVTTDMPLHLSVNKPDKTTIDFCERCKKCAVVCPSQAIPEGGMASVNNVERWRINSRSVIITGPSAELIVDDAW